MSDISNTSETKSTVTPKRATIADANAKESWEKEEGIVIRVHLNPMEETDENYLGSLRLSYDPDGFSKKLARLRDKWRMKNRRRAGEEIPEVVNSGLVDEASVGTWVRGLFDWLEQDSSPMADTEENLLRLVQLNVVTGYVNRAITDRTEWEDAYKKALLGN